MNAEAKFRAVVWLSLAASVQAQTVQPAVPPIKPMAQPVKAAPTGAAAKVHKVQAAPFNSNVIVLDPAHGGADSGADLGVAGSEREFNQAFAQRLKTLLAADGFNVFVTASATDDVAADQRAELMNRQKAVACLVLHSTAAGHGVHLFTSALTPRKQGATKPTIEDWDSAQSASLADSTELASRLATGFNSLHIPVVVSRVSVRPVDSLSCPAVVLEIAPASGTSSVASEAYQQQLAASIATTVGFWRQRQAALLPAPEVNGGPATAAKTPAQKAATPKPATSKPATPQTAPAPTPSAMGGK